MPNGPIKPPVVWHLDTDQIDDKSNPKKPDRLTRIRYEMIEFQEGRKDLQKTLTSIQSICEEGNSEESS